MKPDRFGLTDMPFRLTPDDRYFFASAEHRRALSHLLFGLAQHEGFIVVTGEVGSGKTTLVQRLMSELSPENYRIVTITTPTVSANALISLIAADFGVQRAVNKAALILGLRERWRADHARNRRALILVDEAQGASREALEELRMLSNLTDRSRSLVQTVLLGQPEFRRTLAGANMHQLRQRVLASYHLGPLSAADVGHYIRHRMRAAGAERTDIFEPDAIEAVARITGGIPRLINRLCGRALLNATLEEADSVSTRSVEMVAAELEADLTGGVDPPDPPTSAPGGRNEEDYEQLLHEGRSVISRLGQYSKFGSGR